MRLAFLERYAPYLLVLPTLLYMGFFIGYPLLEAVRLAFTDEQGRFTLENFEYVLFSPFSKFREALFYTLALAGVIIPIEVAVALGLSMLLSRRFWGRSTALYVIILPLVISDVAAGLIWYAMLYEYGFINRVLMSLGLLREPFYVFGFTDRMFAAIVVTEVWRATAIVFVIVFAGLQMISSELIEAAEVFGATGWQKFRHIVFPLLKPSLQAALIIRTLFAMQVFGVVWILAGRDIPVLAGEAYWELTELHHYGAASVYALVIAAISLTLGAVYIRAFRAKYLEAGGV